MAFTLKSIREQVKDRLPFLLSVVNADTLIDAIIPVTMIEMAPQTGLVDPDWLDETKYTAHQTIFFAAYTAYKLLLRRVTETVSGDGSQGNIGTGNKILVEGTVDVLTAKFDIIKASDKDLGIDTNKLLALLQVEVCTVARQLKYSLLICGNQPCELPEIRFVEFT